MNIHSFDLQSTRNKVADNTSNQRSSSSSCKKTASIHSIDQKRQLMSFEKAKQNMKSAAAQLDW